MRCERERNVSLPPGGPGWRVSRIAESDVQPSGASRVGTLDRTTARHPCAIEQVLSARARPHLPPDYFEQNGGGSFC